MPTSEHKLIHWCSLHCNGGNSDKLYTLLVCRIDPDAAYVGGRPRFEVFATWGARGQQQKDTYKFGGESIRSVAEQFDRKVREQQSKGYHVVQGGIVDGNFHFWDTTPPYPLPPTCRGNLPVGTVNTGSGQSSRPPVQMSDHEPGPIAQAMNASRNAGSYAEALSTPVYTGRSAKDQAHDAQQQAEVQRLKAEMEELQRKLAAAGVAVTADPANSRVSRRIILEEE